MKNSRRQWLSQGAVAVASAGITACGGADANNEAKKPAFVLVHGAWHGAWTYEKVVPALAKLGHVAVARDLPGHGVNARFPDSYLRRDPDPALFAGAFATERSPLAEVSLEDYATATLDTIDAVRALGHDKVVLVGHSLGGLTVTRVVEKAPEKIAHVVYLTAFMLPPGKMQVDYTDTESLVGACVVSNPVVAGALRIDFNSVDPVYKARCRQAFYGDVAAEGLPALENLPTPDEPWLPFVTKMSDAGAGVSARRGVPRHYIRCLQDRAIGPALQLQFIAETDAAVGGAKTVVHTLDTSHSPFMSRPADLAQLLSTISTGR